MSTPAEDIHVVAEDEVFQHGTQHGGPRKRLFLALLTGIVLVGGSYYAYDTLVASRHAATDNAYVGADIAQITPQVAGPVLEVMVKDTEHVKRGEILVRLDDTDAKNTLARAEAALALTERRVRNLISTDEALGAQIAAQTAKLDHAEAQQVAAQADLERARIDFTRREKLAKSGSVSGDELTAARNALKTAEARLHAANASCGLAKASRAAAIANREASKALIDNTTLETHPEIVAARAARDQAQTDLERTIVRAPVDGIVSRRRVQVGQRVNPGTALMAVVPIQDAYVDANFKEVQLNKVRPGQPVTLTSDLYGDGVEYHGRVVGFSGGTGAAFAIVPAQNATGNWIKVVQRVPVRISLDPKELSAHPLAVGLSMTADIDVSE